MIVAIVWFEGGVFSASAGRYLEAADISVRHEDDVETISFPDVVDQTIEKDGVEEVPCS